MSNSNYGEHTPYITSAEARVREKYRGDYWNQASQWWDALPSDGKKKVAEFIKHSPNSTGEPLFIRAYGMRRNSILKWFWY
jgi:hypothetical protein